MPETEPNSQKILSVVTALFSVLRDLGWLALIGWLFFSSEIAAVLVEKLRSSSEFEVSGFGGGIVIKSPQAPRDAPDVKGVEKPPTAVAPPSPARKPSAEEIRGAIVGMKRPTGTRYGGQGDAAYQFSYKLSALPEVSRVKFTFPHATMPPQLKSGVTVLPEEWVSYTGWGCLYRVEAEVEFNDGSKTKVDFDACKAIAA
jgi:hypothetical protein